MTEDQKYQGALYKEKKNKNKKTTSPPPEQHPVKKMAQPAYVEDLGDDADYDSWDEIDEDDTVSPAEPLPEAPTPPSAAPNHDDHVNVFDFLVATGQTPNASHLNLPREEGPESTSLVRFEKKEEEDDLDPAAFMEEDDEPLISYGSGPIPAKLNTPAAAKAERREKKDKKRKRLHVDVPIGDQVMTDAPPVLHSGLTGGLKGLLRNQLPPSPDYSGGDGNEPSPASPMKKTKHTKSKATSIFGLMSASAKLKTKKQRTKTKKSSHRTRDEKVPKLIEYRPHTKDGKGDSGDEAANQLVVYKPRGEVFLNFVDKGPDSIRGCSMNKALKRFHRSRKECGSTIGKGKEEKELFRSLRLRRNDRGEIVLFSEDFDLDDVAV